MTIAAAYIRVSTDDQLEFSPDAQLRALNEYAKKNNINIPDEFIFVDEGKSGKSVEQRPAFQKMIKIAKVKPKPFDAILVHKFDRFARNREDSIVYKSLLRKECGVKVISITEHIDDDKFSVILEAMLEAMAEYYSLNLADEVKKGMTEKAMQGGFMARPPFGYAVAEEGQPPIIVKEQAEIVKLIFDKFINVGSSYYAIVKYLNNLGIKTNTGGPFSTTRVKYILSNPFYCGTVIWNMRDSNDNYKVKEQEDWIITEGLHKPIITKEQFYAAERRMKTIKKRARPAELTSHYFSGLMRCGDCGGSMSFNNRKNGPYFQCENYTKNSTCTSHSISAKKITEAVLENIQGVIDEKLPATIETIQTDTSESELLKKELSNIKGKLQRAKEAYINEIDTLEEYKENKELILKKKAELEEQIKSLKSVSVSETKLKENLKHLHKTILDDSISTKEKQKVIRQIIQRITFNKADRSINIRYHVIV